MKNLLLGLLICGCGGSPDKVLFTPKPECMGDPVTPCAGTFPQVINTLAIGSVQDGFDLDGDGKPDNKLAAVSSLAQSAISDAVSNYEIIIPIEYFNMPTVAADTCVKFAIYLGAFDEDGDGDMSRPGIIKVATATITIPISIPARSRSSATARTTRLRRPRGRGRPEQPQHDRHAGPRSRRSDGRAGRLRRHRPDGRQQGLPRDLRRRQGQRLRRRR